MKDLSIYVEKLLYNHALVIIPGFGAFVSNKKTAELLQDKTFTPPQKELSFNPRLVYQDGLVANFISKEEGISYEEAQKYIKEAVDFWKQELNLGKQLVFENLGIFYKEGQDSIIFEPSQNKNFLTESFGMGPIKANEVSKEEETFTQNIPSQENEILENPLIGLNEQELNVNSEGTKKKFKIPAIAKYAAVALVGLSAIGYGVFYFLTSPKFFGKADNLTASVDTLYIQNKVKEHISQASFLADNPFSLSVVALEVKKDPELVKKRLAEEKARKVANEKAEKEARLAAEKAEKEEKLAAQKAEKEEKLAAQKAEKEEKLAAQKAKKEQDTDSSSEVSANAKYHLVAGAFSTRANALNRIKQLKSKGFSDAVLVGKNEKGLFLVSYKSFSDQGQAQAYMSEVKAQGNETWMLVK